MMHLQSWSKQNINQSANIYRWVQRAAEMQKKERKRDPEASHRNKITEVSLVLSDD